MGDFYNTDDEFDTDDDFTGQGDGPAELRKAQRAASRKVKELEKQLAERDEQIKTLTEKTRTVDLGDLLQKNGANRKVAALVPKDVELSEEAVKAWLDEYKDVLNITVTDPGQDAEKDAPPEPVDDDTTQGSDVADIPPEVLAAVQQYAELGGSGGTPVPAGAVGNLVSDVEANAKSLEDVLKIMSKHGLETVNGY